MYLYCTRHINSIKLNKFLIVHFLDDLVIVCKLIFYKYNKLKKIKSVKRLKQTTHNNIISF